MCCKITMMQPRNLPNAGSQKKKRDASPASAGAVASSTKERVFSRFSTASITVDEQANTSSSGEPTSDKSILSKDVLLQSGATSCARRNSATSVGSRTRRASVESSASTIRMHNFSEENRRHSSPDVSPDLSWDLTEEEHLTKRNSAPSLCRQGSALHVPHSVDAVIGADGSKRNEVWGNDSGRCTKNDHNALTGKHSEISGDSSAYYLSNRRSSEGNSGSACSSLTDAEYEEFVNRKKSSRGRNGMTYSERMRRESDHDSCGSSIGSDSQISAIGAMPDDRTSTDFSNADRFKHSTVADTITIGAHEENNNEDVELSSAARFKYGLASRRRSPDVDRLLFAEVHQAPPAEREEEEKRMEELSDDEESMMSAIEAAWRAGASVRRQARRGSKISTSMSSEGDDEELHTSIRATLVEDDPVEVIMPVEAIAVDDEAEAERKRKLKKQIILVYIPILLLVIVITVMLTLELAQMGSLERDEDDVKIDVPLPPKVYDPTLVQLGKEGLLRCGVPFIKQGLSSFNNLTGEKEGMSVDLCKAVAATVLGSGYRVELFEVKSITRFTALAGRDIDLLIYGDTHTMEREFHEKATGVGFQFSDPYLYDGLSFAGVPHAVECADNFNWLGNCSDLMICVYAGSTHQDILSRKFPRQRLVLKETQDSYLQAFVDGNCLVIAGEQNHIAQMAVRNAGYEGDYVYGNKTLSKEPLAMVTRKNDQSWSEEVNWILRALIRAEKQNATQNNALSVVHDRRIVAALEAVGNYGEIFARHMEKVVPRKGLNQLYTEESNSGLHYSHPFGVIDDFCHDFDPSGTINQITDRGKLICGVFGSEDQSIDTDYCRAVAASLFDSDSSLVDFVKLSNDDNVVERLDNGEIDVIAGAIINFQNDVVPLNKTAAGVSGLTFSKPYFYGESSFTSRAMAASQIDADWSSFVYWVVMGHIWAEENDVTSKDFQEARGVELFGPRFEWMFRGAIIGRGNYAEIYNRNIDTLSPRAYRNLINNGSTPQLWVP